MDNTAYLRYLAGDDSAFEEIVTQYRDGLMLYICTFVKDINLAEEICEDVFVKLAIRRPRFYENGHFKTWLYTIGRNEAISTLRKIKRRSEIPLEEAAESICERQDLEKNYILTEQKRELHSALLQLNEGYREVLRLVYLEGFSNSEAARIMHKSNRQIENLLFRAKAALKEKLLKEGFVYEKL